MPLVVVMRSSADAAAVADMCWHAEVQADTNITVHVWARGADGYEQARDLQALVRTAINGETEPTGWTLQQETDQYDPSFRAWLISSDWFAGSLVLE